MIHIRTPIYVYTNKSPNLQLEVTIQFSHQGQTSHPGVESHRRGGEEWDWGGAKRRMQGRVTITVLFHVV